MKKKLLTILWLGVSTACFILLTAFDKPEVLNDNISPSVSNDQLKKAAYEILDGKCNVCHRKKNPFMIFNMKNMSRRAPKIYKMVFVERKMPKGNEIRLSQDEAATLEKWLFTQEIF